jgi:hypothetical protein
MKVCDVHSLLPLLLLVILAVRHRQPMVVQSYSHFQNVSSYVCQEQNLYAQYHPSNSSSVHDIW